MKTSIKYVALVGSVALLAGCGGGGDSEVNTYAALEAEAIAAAAGFVDTDTGALLQAERTSLPAAGTASYDGYIGGEVDSAGLIGTLSLDVDFDAGDEGTITGTAGNFQHETDGAYTGNLTLTGGTILPGFDATEPDAILGTLEGDLTNGINIYDTNIALDGEFMGGTGVEVPDAIGGAATGFVGIDIFDGIFIVKTP